MKKTSIIAAIAAAVILAAGCCGDRTIKTKVPARPAGAASMLGFAAEAIDTVHIGFIGLGMRGSGAITRYLAMPGAVISALCDLVPENVEAARARVVEAGFTEPGLYTDGEGWKEVCRREDIDLIYICTDWESHVPIALYAMECGKHVAIEVPAATTLKECWDLVNTSERTRRHCIMLENCVYDFFEMSALTLARDGMLGEIIHGEGAYCHNLDRYWDRYWNSWRLEFNRRFGGDVYATHGFGPLCQAMNIHRGDRLKTLVSMDTGSFNGRRHYEARSGEACPDFAGADETSTLIRTEKGKTILLEHCVMTPRPYSRMYQLVGTDGFAGKYPVQQVCLRKEGAGAVDYRNPRGEKVYSGDELTALLEGHRNPVNTPELEALAKQVGGHGGMDFIMDYRLIYCLRNGLPLDMDVYDLAEWCCVGELSRISIAHGSAPVEVPDFTRGEWDVLKGFDYAF